MSKSIADMKIPSVYTRTLFKTTRVTTALKNTGSLLDYGNYRPTSCIPDVVKIMEQVLHRKLKQYLFKREFIARQSAYRSGRSTETALHRVVPDLLDGVNGGLYSGTCMWFLDIAKWFGTTDHDI